MREALHAGLPFQAHIVATPTFAPANKPQGVARHDGNESPFPPSPRVLAAITRAAATAQRYPDAACSLLVEALARRHELDPSMVLCANGSDELLALLCQAFLAPTDSAVTSDGTFVTFSIRVALCGARRITTPLCEHHHDLRAMAAAVDGTTRLVYVCNPSNPLGTAVGGADFTTLMENVPPHVIVVADEAYREFVDPSFEFPNTIGLLRGGARNLIVLRTFAKAYALAGLRVGYALGDPAVLAYVAKLKPIFSVNALAQAAALAALEDEEALVRAVTCARRWRRSFTEFTRRLGLAPLEGQANFVTLRVPDDGAFARFLLAEGHAIAPLAGWGLPGYARVSCATEGENARLASKLESFVAWSRIRARPSPAE